MFGETEFEKYRQNDRDVYKDVFDQRGLVWEYEEWLRDFEALQYEYSMANTASRLLTSWNPIYGIIADSSSKWYLNNKMQEFEFDPTDYTNADATEYYRGKNRAIHELETQMVNDWMANVMFAYQTHGSPIAGDPNIEGSPKGWGEHWNPFSGGAVDPSTDLTQTALGGDQQFGWGAPEPGFVTTDPSMDFASGSLWDKTTGETYLQQKYGLTVPWDKDLYNPGRLALEEGYTASQAKKGWR
jgi:hypothetical protein